MVQSGIVLALPVEILPLLKDKLDMLLQHTQHSLQQQLLWLPGMLWGIIGEVLIR